MYIPLRPVPLELRRLLDGKVPLTVTDRNYVTSSNPNKSNKKKSMNKGYVASSKDDQLNTSMLTKKGRELNSSNSKSSEGILPDIEFPENTRLGDFPTYYETDIYFFKSINDLTFKRKWISKFVDGLNIELVDADDYSWYIGKDYCYFYELNGKYNSEIRIEHGVWVSKIIYRYNGNRIMFFIPKKEYNRLRSIFKIKDEHKKMNTVFNMDINVDDVYGS